MLSHPATTLALHIDELLRARPTAHGDFARAVVDEDVPSLIHQLRALGLGALTDQVGQLLDDPGPFLPALRGWT